MQLQNYTKQTKENRYDDLDCFQVSQIRRFTNWKIVNSCPFSAPASRLQTSWWDWLFPYHKAECRVFQTMKCSTENSATGKSYIAHFRMVSNLYAGLLTVLALWWLLHIYFSCSYCVLCLFFFLFVSKKRILLNTTLCWKEWLVKPAIFYILA